MTHFPDPKELSLRENVLKNFCFCITDLLTKKRQLEIVEQKQLQGTIVFTVIHVHYAGLFPFSRTCCRFR